MFNIVIKEECFGAVVTKNRSRLEDKKATITNKRELERKACLSDKPASGTLHKGHDHYLRKYKCIYNRIWLFITPHTDRLHSVTHLASALACRLWQGCTDLPSWLAGRVCSTGSGNGQNGGSQTGSYRTAWLSARSQTEPPADTRSSPSVRWCCGSWLWPATRKVEKLTVFI